MQHVLSLLPELFCVKGSSLDCGAWHVLLLTQQQNKSAPCECHSLEHDIDEAACLLVPD